MTDYYELLGVEPDAARDEIKTAYRQRRESTDAAAKAELNRAWNVLSDPIQRERYDAKQAEGQAEAGDDDGVAVPAKRATGARPAAARGSRRPPLEPTIALTAGMELATPKARNLALLFDVSVILVLVFAAGFFVPRLMDPDFAKWQSKATTLSKTITDAQSAEDKANGRVSKADATAKKEDKAGNVVAAGVARGQAEHARDEAARAAAKRKSADKARTRIERDHLQVPGIVGTAVGLVLALLYCVPMSARTGQTIGKRLQKIELVRVDGAPAGWGGSLTHYGVPILLAIVIPTLGAIAAFGMVLWNLRDRNRQGVHDKLAKTLVVAVPPVGS